MRTLRRGILADEPAEVRLRRLRFSVLKGQFIPAGGATPGKSFGWMVSRGCTRGLV
jgi:hypothetical protein